MSEKKFRIRSKAIFLTYSQVKQDVDREIFSNLLFQCLKGKMAKICSGIAVAFEKHKDGGIHIHALLDFSDCFDTENKSYFDIQEMHPNMQAVRSRQKVLGYILKEDGRAYLDDHMKSLCCLWPETGKYLAENYLRKGFGPDLTATKMGMFGFNNVSKIRQWWKAKQAGMVREKDMAKPGIGAVLERVLPYRKKWPAIVEALEEVKRFGGNRPLKTKNLLLWSSEPSVGKTTFCQSLQKYVKNFDFPTDGWWDGYEDNFFEMIIWNEVDFIGWKITDLNRLFEGSSLKLPIKGAKQTKTDNPLIICTSNLSLEGLLRQKRMELSMIKLYLPILRSRITEIEVTEKGFWELIEAVG